VGHKEHWHKYHEQWRSRDGVPANPRTIKAIRSITDVKGGKKILEVGSGSGRDSIYLAKLGADCYLVDYVETPLRIAKKIANRENVGVTTVKGDAGSLPFRDSYFDVVYSQGLIEHFTKPELLIKEQIRVLRKDGYMLVDVPQKYHVYTIIKHLLMLFNKWTPGWETEYTVWQLENLLKNCGLQLVYTYGDWSHPNILLKAISMVLRISKKQTSINLFQDSDSLLGKFKKSRLAHYTFQHIGIIGRK
jgi:ubiquinone/menaquinone biosynthesis C-methylase UbiE